MLINCNKLIKMLNKFLREFRDVGKIVPLPNAGYGCDLGSMGGAAPKF